jgi:hypothetical protein
MAHILHIDIITDILVIAETVIRDFGDNAELDILMASKFIAKYIADPVVNAFGLLVKSKDQALNMKNRMQNQILCMRRVKDEAKELRHNFNEIYNQHIVTIVSVPILTANVTLTRNYLNFIINRASEHELMIQMKQRAVKQVLGSDE